MSLPGRTEGGHICVGRIVAEEAERLIGFALHDPPRHHEVLQEDIAAALGAYLRTGWCRLQQDNLGIRIVYWREDFGSWVLYDKTLDAYYRKLPLTRLTAVFGQRN